MLLALASSSLPVKHASPARKLPCCSTSLHYIRCLKPNSQQVAGRFDASLVLHQLRCCGVLEVARIAAAGYPTRYLHAEFAARYRELLPELGSGGWCRACLGLACWAELDGALSNGDRGLREGG